MYWQYQRLTWTLLLRMLRSLDMDTMCSGGTEIDMGVAVYIQNYIPAKQHKDLLMLNGLGALWVQLH